MSISLRKFVNKKTILLLIVLLAVLFLYNTVGKTLTLSPSAEKEQLQELELLKKSVEISEFVSDGCSGNVSKNWKFVVINLSSVSSAFASKYKDATRVPFEDACITHDRTYHEGVGGYTARLLADNKLRTDILQYGIDNAENIKEKIGLESPEQVIFLYEKMADLIYRGVRIGGAPCTGEPYAWGYGYNEGDCSL